MSTIRKRRGLFVATVRDNRPICRDHFRLTLAVRNFPPAGPGQFVQLGCTPPDEPADEPDLHEWVSPNDPGLRTRSLLAPTPLLRRPFSLAGVHPDPADATVSLLEIIGRAIGLGTTRLSRLAVGEQIDLIGPLGNRFALPDPGQTAVLVGGGVGIPPMIYLAECLAAADRPAVAIAGVTTAAYLPLTVLDGAMPSPAGEPTLCVAEFARYGVATTISSDDGTIGVAGRATVPLTTALDGLALPPERVVIYTCGPERMMRAVTELAVGRGIRVWVAMERAMACGIGTCQSCVCKTRKDDGDWQYKLVCTDGSIFDGREIVWD